MGKYKTESKVSIIGNLIPGPLTEYVVDVDTGEIKGEVTRWPEEEAGKLIAEGKWEPYSKESGAPSDD
jgi:hypothetical protein